MAELLRILQRNSPVFFLNRITAIHTEQDPMAAPEVAGFENKANK